MRVLLTGATGLVGSHTAAALARDDFALRVLVRDPARLERALAPLGVKEPEVVCGDVTDPGVLAAALTGCDAVVHAAALFTLDRRRAAEITRTNVSGTRNVLGAAARLGLDPIVHVSSIAALFPPDGALLTTATSVKQPRDPYAASKADAERIARQLQDDGAPVVIVYPGQIWGPHDPTFGDGIRATLGYLRAGLFPWTPGGFPMIDARDLAAILRAALAPGRGPRRYMAGGPFVTPRTLADAFERVTGRRVRTPRVPGALMRGVGRIGDWSRHLGFSHGLTREAMVTLTRGVPCDDAPTLAELGTSLRPLDETLRDTLGWLATSARF